VPQTGGAVWAAVDGHAQLGSSVRALIFGESKSGTDYTYQQWSFGGGLGLQLKRFNRPHLVDPDQDKEHPVVVAAGYEYLATDQPPTETGENRVVTEATLRVRPPAEFLLADRNRVEFRWVDGVYSARYRNRFSVERASRLGGLRFTPYASAEFFYDWAHDAWNEEHYIIGIEWPYRQVLKLSTYYLRQNCSTCRPADLNILGLTLGYFYQH
jgi:hypothetical protein